MELRRNRKRTRPFLQRGEFSSKSDGNQSDEPVYPQGMANTSQKDSKGRLGAVESVLGGVFFGKKKNFHLRIECLSKLHENCMFFWI